MEETKVITLATGEEAKEATGITVIKRVMQTAIINRVLIDEKKAKASQFVEAILKKIPSISTTDDKTDAYVEQAIVKINNILVDMEKLRKEYTGTVREWLGGEIGPENELKLELQKLRDLRNDRAKRINEEANKKKAEIDAQKKKDSHVIEVKQAMRLAVEKGVIDKVVAFDLSIAEHFKKLTIKNAPAMKGQLSGLKPKLKEEVYNAWLVVPWDAALMTQSEFDDLVTRAKTYFLFDKISAEYTRECEDIIKKYIDKIPQKVKELEIIAAGGEQGERVKKIVEQREAAEQSETKKAVEQKVAAVQSAVNEETFQQQNSVDFKAQAQTQSIPKASGSTRQEVYYTIDNPADTRQVAAIIGSIIIHTIASKSAEQKIKMVVQHDDKGKPKVNEDGTPVYTSGIQFWLNVAATIDYTLDIKGITKRHAVKAINKAAR